MAYKEYSKNMNERMMQTEEGRKSMQQYNAMKMSVKSAPKKAVKMVMSGFKKIISSRNPHQ